MEAMLCNFLWLLTRETEYFSTSRHVKDLEGQSDYVYMTA